MAYTVWRPKGDLLPRTITGVVAIPAVIFIILQGSIFFQILATLAAFILLREWSILSFGTPYSWLSIICFSSVLLSCFMPQKLWILLLPFTGCVWLLYSKIFQWKKLFIISIGYFYITIASLIIVNILPILGINFIILVLALVWSIDTGAFIMGKTIGGPKLAPKISPNKTWAGFFGGIVFCLLSVSLLIKKMNFDASSKFWVFVICSIFLAQGGDLLESWCKRYFNVKDSGSFLPGHGGVLDRLDSLLAVSFAIAVFWYFR